MNCNKNGIKKEGESCTLNNNCIYPKCINDMTNNYIELHPSKVVKNLTKYKKYTKKDMIDFAEYTFQTWWEDSASKMLNDWIKINNK